VARVAAVVIARAGVQDELLRVLYRKLPEQPFVDEREDRGVRADAERDRQQRLAGEERRPYEAANRVSEIARELLHLIAGAFDGKGGRGLTD
jgi:hypothetical protein